jgi:vacuolar-type H+-ATPase catalytic subunit A/Vma1
MARIKVQGGVIGSAGVFGLCGTCRSAHIREHANNDVVVTCGLLDRGNSGTSRITSPVVRCRDYAEHSSVDKWDMEKIAWLVSTDPKTKKLGFSPPKKESNVE